MINCYVLAFIYLIGVFFHDDNNSMIIELDEMNAHPFHLSKCHIKYKEIDTTLELSLVLFVDDFEDALKSVSANDRLHLCDDLALESTISLIEQYLDTHLSIYDSQEQLYSSYIGSECSNNGLTIWSYIEYKLTEKPKSIRVKNEILISLFDDQKNIVDVELSKGNLVERLMTNELTEAIFDD